MALIVFWTVMSIMAILAWSDIPQLTGRGMNILPFISGIDLGYCRADQCSAVALDFHCTMLC